LGARKELLRTLALQNAIFRSANFQSIATDAKDVIQIFNVGTAKMLGYSAADVMNGFSELALRQSSCSCSNAP
jgi:sensor histidine kinase regulating citrate/malate metabolism